jgi:hypothetical protein
MVGRAERPLFDEAPAHQEPGHGVQARHLQCLAPGHSGQDARQTAGEHRLSSTGWSHQQPAMAAG